MHLPTTVRWPENVDGLADRLFYNASLDRFFITSQFGNRRSWQMEGWYCDDWANNRETTHLKVPISWFEPVADLFCGVVLLLQEMGEEVKKIKVYKADVEKSLRLEKGRVRDLLQEWVRIANSKLAAAASDREALIQDTKTQGGRMRLLRQLADRRNQESFASFASKLKLPPVTA